LSAIQRSIETKFVQMVYKMLKNKCLYYADFMLGMSRNLSTKISFVLLWITYLHWLTSYWVVGPTRISFNTVATFTHQLQNTWDIWRPPSFQIAVGPLKCLVVYYVNSHWGYFYLRWVKFSRKRVTSLYFYTPLLLDSTLRR